MATLVKPAVLSENCPHCGKENFYDEDESAESILCWNCERLWFLEWFLWEDWYPTAADEEEALYESIHSEGRRRI